MNATVRLECEIWDRPARILLHLSARGGGEVNCDIRLHGEGFSARSGCTFWGYDLAQFIIELCALHKTLAQPARLSTSDELVDLRLGVVDAGSGSIRVDARIRIPTDCNSKAPVLAPGPFGSFVEVVFAGLRTDQSYLPQVIRDLESFIAESGVSTRSPWEGIG